MGAQRRTPRRSHRRPQGLSRARHLHLGFVGANPRYRGVARHRRGDARLCRFVQGWPRQLSANDQDDRLARLYTAHARYPKPRRRSALHQEGFAVLPSTWLSESAACATAPLNSGRCSCPNAVLSRSDLYRAVKVAAHASWRSGFACDGGPRFWMISFEVVVQGTL